MKAISNAGPLIHLAKAGLLDYLFTLFDQVIIPKTVYEEVVVVGKQNGHIDAIIIEQAIKNNKIYINKEPIKSIDLVYPNLHKGEKEAIELAIQLNENVVLLDDEEARLVARKYNLKVKGTLGVLIELTKRKLIDSQSALQYLRKLNSIMYLSSDLYARVEDILNKNE